jgi:N-acetylglucosamine kinase-like BadF-type ATPase
LTGGLSGRPGIVLIGGTGAACLGRDARGRTYLCGGWGDMADDLGSAVWIGLRAIQSAVQSEDGRIGPTLLREAVFDHLGLSEPRALLDRLHNQGFARADMGKIAPLVVEASLKGDAVAESILRDAARELSRLVATTAANLFGGTPSEMILVGGLALSGPPFQPMLIQQIQADTPSIRVVDPEMTPVQGAALEALRAAGHPWNAEVLANLQAGQA